MNLPDFGYSTDGAKDSSANHPPLFQRMGRAEMTRLVESVLRIQLKPLRRAGLDVRVYSSDQVVLAQVVYRNGIEAPSLRARIAQERWWNPGDTDQGSRVAGQLGAQLLALWWCSEDGLSDN